MYLDCEDKTIRNIRSTESPAYNQVQWELSNLFIPINNMFIWVLHKPEETDTTFWKITGHQQQLIKIRHQLDCLGERWFPRQPWLGLTRRAFPQHTAKFKAKTGLECTCQFGLPFSSDFPPAYTLNRCAKRASSNPSARRQRFCTHFTEALLGAGGMLLPPSHLSV